MQMRINNYIVLLSACVALSSGCARRGSGGAPTAGSADPSAAGQRQTYAGGAVIEPDDSNLLYTGHWDESHLAEEAITVNSGSRITCTFTGHTILGRFGTSGITHPAQIYVSIDSGQPEMFTLDSQLINFALSPLSGGRHTLQIVVKDVDERADRWIPPLASAVIFKGLVLDADGRTLPLPAPSDLRMEFYGDSITQGVRALSMAIGTTGSDGAADYAFLTAVAFGAEANQVGFGRQGIIRTGDGDVPPAPESFGWNFKGSRADPAFIPQVVVVNQGTNDGAYPSNQFEPAYRAYIAEIRKAYPKAAIFCMRPFGGYHAEDIRRAAASLKDSKIFYVDTTGWLTASDYTDGVHPTVAGHLKAARKLIRAISLHTGLKPVRKVGDPWWK